MVHLRRAAHTSRPQAQRVVARPRALRNDCTPSLADRSHAIVAARVIFIAAGQAHRVLIACVCASFRLRSAAHVYFLRSLRQRGPKASRTQALPVLCRGHATPRRGAGARGVPHGVRTVRTHAWLHAGPSHPAPRFAQVPSRADQYVAQSPPRLASPSPVGPAHAARISTDADGARQQAGPG